MEVIISYAGSNVFSSRFSFFALSSFFISSSAGPFVASPKLSVLQFCGIAGVAGNPSSAVSSLKPP